MSLHKGVSRIRSNLPQAFMGYKVDSRVLFSSFPVNVQNIWFISQKPIPVNQQHTGLFRTAKITRSGWNQKSCTFKLKMAAFALVLKISARECSSSVKRQLSPHVWLSARSLLWNVELVTWARWIIMLLYKKNVICQKLHCNWKCSSTLFY